MVAASNKGVCSLPAVVAVKILYGILIAAFVFQLAVVAAFDGAVAGIAVCIEISHDLFVNNIDAACVVWGGFIFV